jgi:endonuclease/exonuclease/phosphatase family metal-dependent hydrolase
MACTHRIPGLALVVVAILGGCSEGDGGQATVATFNLGLAFGYVEEASARIDPIIAALEASAFDLVCLQELWVDQDEAGQWTTNVIDRVLTGVARTYPHAHWSRTEISDDTPQVGCGIDEADMLLACAEPACGDAPPENLAGCVLENCGEEFDATSPMCQNCMVTNLGRPLEEIVEACRGVIRGGVVYDGHNGLAIISKHPLESTGVLELDYALTARSVLYATVDLPGAGLTDVYCTHLAADLSGEIAYPEEGSFSSFAQENAAQTERLLEHVEASSSAASIALLGDFNHGPARGDYRAELPDHYRMIIDAGYESPITQVDPPRCTFCDDNLLVDRTGPGGKSIDHVYLRVRDGVDGQDVGVIYDEPIEVIGASGEPRQVHLSDHYGVVVTLTN